MTEQMDASVHLFISVFHKLFIPLCLHCMWSHHYSRKIARLSGCAHPQLFLSQKTFPTCTVYVIIVTMHARDVYMSNHCVWLPGLTPISICLHCPINVLSWSQQFLSLFVGEDGSLPFHSSVILLQFRSADSIKSVTIFSPEDVSLQ